MAQAIVAAHARVVTNFDIQLADDVDWQNRGRAGPSQAGLGQARPSLILKHYSYMALRLTVFDASLLT